MDISNNIPEMQSSPSSFHTVQEFCTPLSSPASSEFEGFLADDEVVPLQTRANSVNAPTGPVSSPASSEFEGFLDDDAIPTGSLPLLAPPPTCNTPTESLPRPLAPPPTSNADGSVKSFPSLETAFLYCQTWGRDHGYAIRKCRTKRKGKAPALIYKVYIECECASKKRSTKTPDQYRVRKDQSSRACGCPFRGSIIEENGSWSIRINEPEHKGHLPFLRPSDSAIHRRTARTAQPEMRQQVQHNLKSRIEPKKTLDSWLQKNSATPVILKDVYNMYAAAKKDRDGGLPAIQALFTNLQKEDSRFLYDHITDTNNQLWNILFFGKTSLHFLHQFLSTIVLDSTYKSRKSSFLSFSGWMNCG